MQWSSIVLLEDKILIDLAKSSTSKNLYIVTTKHNGSTLLLLSKGSMPSDLSSYSILLYYYNLPDNRKKDKAPSP